MEGLMGFLNGGSIWIYIFIFFGKIIEVAVSTLRIVLINRGERIVGSLVAIVEVSLWLIVTGTVLAGFQSDLIKVIVFVVAFAIGNFIGSWLDERLAFGISAIQIILQDPEEANLLVNELHSSGFGITTLSVKGREEKGYMFMLTLKRSMLKEALEIIENICTNALVTVNDVKAQKGGYIRNSASRPWPFRGLKHR